MPIKKALFNIKGMTRDLAASKFNPEYAYENRNLRLTTTDVDNTTGVMVNERGPKKITNLPVYCEFPLAQTTLGNKIITLFWSHDYRGNINSIYEFDIDTYNNTLNYTRLFEGNIGLNNSYPAECIAIYENDQLEKIYVTDGRTQPKVINITKLRSAPVICQNANYYSNFDFVRELNTTPNIEIRKSSSSTGNFASGTIQYLFSYYSLYGQQSNIFYVSPIYYLAHADRGASESDTVMCSFNITVENFDTSYDYVRIYAAQRTSVNGVPYVRRVADLKINSNYTRLECTDNGEGGTTIAPTDLFYIGGQNITAGTMAQKDNTLFLGDIKLNKIQVTDAIKAAARNINIDTNDSIKAIPYHQISGYYTYQNQLTYPNSAISTFKRGEIYRFGVQLQDKYGQWSDPIFISDKTIGAGPSVENGSLKLIAPTATPSSFTSLASAAGFVRMRPVVVFPSLAERNVLCQGVVNPTVFNAEDRENHFPDFQASWFFRPFSPTRDSQGNVINTLDTEATEYRHNYPIPGNDKKNAEIQCIVCPPYPSSYNGGGETSAQFAINNCECFYVSQRVFTLNSPDIEFDSTLQNVTFSNYNFRIVGFIPIQASVCDVDIQTSSAPLNYSSNYNQYYAEKPIGFYKSTDVRNYEEDSNTGYWGIKAKPYWMDEIYKTSCNNSNKQPAGFIVYPWHKNGSLNNAKNVPDSNTPPSVLYRKKMSILRFSDYTRFNSSAWWNPSSNLIQDIELFNSAEDTIITLPNSNLVYKGNIDKVITFHTQRNTSTSKSSPSIPTYGDAQYADWDPDTISSGSAAYPVILAKATTSTAFSYGVAPRTAAEETANFRNAPATIVSQWDNYGTAPLKWIHMGEEPIVYASTQYVTSHVTDPVSLKYKSTPHLVIVLNNAILPQPGQDIIRQTSLWDSINTVIRNRPYSKNGFLWLGELYTDNISDKFGGTSESAIAANNWVVAGPTVSITSTTLQWTEGDTYYQRYDCLKTYPFTMEDQNSVVDILSFMCETRVNIDGRYDKNRGLSNNLYMSPTNFNLINKNYTQNDNFFTYRSTDGDKLNLNKFPNTITWTKTKTFGEEIDSWTNITLGSTLDLDGNLGQITALRRFKNDLIAFQDRGISQILYNDNVQIASNTGVPIEIANSGKVSGKRYISNNIGCQNKWSICETPHRLYFIDGLTKTIYGYNGQQIEDISNTRGFKSWMEELDRNWDEPWNPVDWYGGVTCYDKVNHEVMFIHTGEALSFSELTNQFTSFYSYGCGCFFNTIQNGSVLWMGDETGYSGYLYQKGNYNQFIDGEYKPFYTTVIVNPNPTEDKIFNNLEFRADAFTFRNSIYTSPNHDPSYTFNKLTVWNEYQKGTVDLVNTLDRPSSLKKKFRVWRANIPRWNQTINSTSPNNRDRMRNPWLYLKLSMEGNTALSQNKKVVLHDLVVDYFE